MSWSFFILLQMFFSTFVVSRQESIKQYTEYFPMQLIVAVIPFILVVPMETQMLFIVIPWGMSTLLCSDLYSHPYHLPASLRERLPNSD